jgi:hypothetical protein
MDPLLKTLPSSACVVELEQVNKNCAKTPVLVRLVLSLPDFFAGRRDVIAV